MESLTIIISLVTPLVVTFFGYLLNRHLSSIEQKREEERIELEGRHKYRIQFNMEANFTGVQKKYCIAEFLILMENQGFTRFEFDEIRLKVQGIHADAEIELFQKNYSTKHVDSIVKFPHDLIRTNMLARLKKDQKDESEKVIHFIEPGVIQRFTYVAAIPKDTRFILVTASFYYHEKAEHTMKRVFAVKTRNSNKGVSH